MTFKEILEEELEIAGIPNDAQIGWLTSTIERAAIRFSNQQTQDLQARILWYRENYLSPEDEKEYDKFFRITNQRTGNV